MRQLTKNEIQLIDFLIKNSDYVINKPQKSILISEMPDGEMGSLRFNNKSTKNVVSKPVSEAKFIDLDGTCVIATLFIDEDNNITELDLWKVDYSPTIKIPNVFTNV